MTSLYHVDKNRIEWTRTTEVDFYHVVEAVLVAKYNKEPGVA